MTAQPQLILNIIQSNLTRKQVPYERSMASHPRSQFWSPRNQLSPIEVSKGESRIKYWFICDQCSHEFDITPCSVNSNIWCKFCANKALCDNPNCQQCHEKSFASNDKAQYWSLKNILNPRQVLKNSNKKYWFNCDRCPHQFDIGLNHINGGRWCSYCSNPPKRLCEDFNCQQCYEKSFASSDKAQYWSKKNETSPRQIFKNSSKYCFFICWCGHELHISLNNVTNGKAWCRYCAHQALCENPDCKQCYENSFASHPKAIFWSPENKRSPREVFKSSSSNKYDFNCECGHTFDAYPTTVTEGSWCPYCCTSTRKLCDKTNCHQCYERSFASHTKSQYWSATNVIHPRLVAKFSHNQYVFDCPDCSRAFTIGVSFVSIGQWCTCIRNKTEVKLHKFLLTTYPDLTIEYQKTFEWCKKQKYLPFDFCIESLRLIIELDGKQHFKQIPKWTPFEITQENDRYKMGRSREHGYSMIRIYQEDVWHDRNNWQQKLIDAIDTCPTIENIFIGDIYQQHPMTLSQVELMDLEMNQTEPIIATPIMTSIENTKFSATATLIKPLTLTIIPSRKIELVIQDQ